MFANALTSDLVRNDNRAVKPKASKRERMIVDLSSEALKLVEELELRTGSSTRAELFRNMLKFCAAFMDELDEGNIPLWKDKDGQVYKSNIHKVLFLK